MGPALRDAGPSPMFDAVLASLGSIGPLRDERSEEGKQFAPVANYRSHKQFAISPRADHRARRFRSHFSQENTPIHLPYPQGEDSVEFVMRGHAVILAATLAWFISNKSAEAKLDILVDKATQRMLVIQDGYIRFMWPVSTGRDATQTPNGVYAPQRLERNWSSTAYYDSPMPFSIFFYNGYAIHGSYAIDRLGGPASHGCVRLHPHHAAILFDLVQQEGPNRTSIEVTDQGRPEPALLRREIAAGPGVNQPMPRRVRYPVPGDMDNLPPAQRNRLIAAKNALPPKPAPPADRRLLADVRPPASVLRVPSGAGEADTANGSPRLPTEFSDSRSKPKVVVGPKVAEGSYPEPASSTSSIKLLPASCWSGGASRWKWWASSQGNPCK